MNLSCWFQDFNSDSSCQNQLEETQFHERVRNSFFTFYFFFLLVSGSEFMHIVLLVEKIHFQGEIVK